MVKSLDSFLSQLLDSVKSIPAVVLPKCRCGSNAIPIQCTCGAFSCMDCGFFSKRLKVICADCAIEFFGVEEEMEEEELEEFWTILGIKEETHDEQFIEYCFKQKAKTEHPDKGGSNERFKRLQEAKKEALKYARRS
jgi:hypothetical protein